jgi:hypothetical protein
LRVRTLSTLLSCLTFLAIAATPALATTTGGAVAGSTTAPATTAPATTTPATTTPATTAPAIHLSPITAKSRRLTYKGPIYQKTATGEVVPYAAPAPAAQLTNATGGSAVSGATATTADTKPQLPQLLVPGALARYVNGLAAAPMSAPEAVQKVIWAGNEIIGLPYIFGGGHASFDSPGYDCSGTVSFALHGGNLVTAPEDSSEFMAWGSHGAGRWVAVFGNSGHAYMDIAGLRLDTSAADDPTNQQGPRWRPLRTENGGYTVRHPLGL